MKQREPPARRQKTEASGAGFAQPSREEAGGKPEKSGKSGGECNICVNFAEEAAALRGSVV